MIVSTATCDLCWATLTSWSDRAGAEEEITGCGWTTIRGIECHGDALLPREIHICRDHPLGTGTMCPECYADLDPDQWVLIAEGHLMTQTCPECQHVTALGVPPYREVP